MFDTDRLYELYLNPNVGNDQYEDVRIITAKSEYVRIVTELAEQRVGLDSSMLITEMRNIAQRDDVVIKQSVSRVDGRLTVIIDADDVDDCESIAKSLTLIQQALIEEHDGDFLVEFDPPVVINKRVIPCIGYH